MRVNYQLEWFGNLWGDTLLDVAVIVVFPERFK